MPEIRCISKYRVKRQRFKKPLLVNVLINFFLLGRTPLHIATVCNSIACMRLLLSRGALADAVDDEGRTPYHLAGKGGLTKALAVLLEASLTPSDESSANSVKRPQ